jgi:acetyl esterase
LSKAELDWYRNAYAPDPATWSQPKLSPLKASLNQLRGLPPALVITAEHDALRDEGEAYAHKLMQAGVPVTAARYQGTIHDVVILNALANSPAARAAIAQANEALREALAKPAHRVSRHAVAGGEIGIDPLNLSDDRSTVGAQRLYFG